MRAKRTDPETAPPRGLLCQFAAHNDSRGGIGMTALLFLAQRAGAGVLAFAVVVHLATIIYAVRGGLTAAEVLGRTRANGWFLAFYLLFVLAVAVHAPIGVRNILREWTRLSGRATDLTACAFALILLMLGMRAVAAIYLP
jgi:fumarate reductase subunit C